MAPECTEIQIYPQECQHSEYRAMYLATCLVYKKCYINVHGKNEWMSIKTAVWTKKFLKLKGTPPPPAVTPGRGCHPPLHEPSLRWLLPFSQLRGYSSGWDCGCTRGARTQAAERPFRTFSEVDYLLNSISTRIIMWIIPGNCEASLLWRNYFKPFSQYNFILQGKKNKLEDISYPK